MINWLPGILDSFSSAITNGFTEGCNNKIKVLKRNAYGYRNFKRFRNRILHIFSHQTQKQATAWLAIACLFQFFFFGFTPTIDIDPKNRGDIAAASTLIYSYIFIYQLSTP